MWNATGFIMDSILDAIWRAAELIARADGLIITAGAGMGIDSGLPDFRGTNGFWNAYPALGHAMIHFEEIASPHYFHENPRLAWGFYGHRLQLYRQTPPHAGFALLRQISEGLPHGAHIVTSNVDGHFQYAGFDPERITEIHGSIHHLQCLRPCQGNIWPAEAFQPEIDAHACRITSDMPRCTYCNGIARPNVLMFNDTAWLSTRSEAQEERLHTWLEKLKNPVAIEIGAGTRIASIRQFGEHLGCPLIRINPNEAQVRGSNNVSIPEGALDALREIHASLKEIKA